MNLLSFKDLIDQFLLESDEIRHFSVNSLRAYRIDLCQTFDINNRFQIINEIDLLKNLKAAQIRWSHLEPSTRQRKSSAIKAFTNWLFEKKWIQSPLGDKIELPKIPKKIPHYLSIDEVILLLSKTKVLVEQQNQYHPYLVLIYLLYGGGLRVSEACSIRWSDLKIKSKELRVHGKGDKERLVSLPSSVINSVLKLPKIDPYIWGQKPLNTRTAFDWVRTMGKNAGLQAPLNPHALRHSYATHLITSGINIRTLQELLGHASLTATEKYTHLSMDQLARALENHHPLGAKERVK